MANRYVDTGIYSFSLPTGFLDLPRQGASKWARGAPTSAAQATIFQDLSVKSLSKVRDQRTREHTSLQILLAIQYMKEKLSTCYHLSTFTKIGAGTTLSFGCYICPEWLNWPQCQVLSGLLSELWLEEGKWQSRERKIRAHLQSGAIYVSGKLHFHSMRHCQDFIRVDLAHTK